MTVPKVTILVFGSGKLVLTGAKVSLSQQQAFGIHMTHGMIDGS